jgi:hypothetical protein
MKTKEAYLKQLTDLVADMVEDGKPPGEIMNVLSSALISYCYTMTDGNSAALEAAFDIMRDQWDAVQKSKSFQ